MRQVRLSSLRYGLRMDLISQCFRVFSDCWIPVVGVLFLYSNPLFPLFLSLSLSLSLSELSELLRAQTRTLEMMIPIVCNYSIASSNPWTPSKCSGGRSPQFRRILMQSLNYNKKRLPVCMVTGIHGDGSCVIAGHIIPCSTDRKILSHLGIDTTCVNMPQNGIFWVRGIEDAWESLALSFVKSNPLEDKYYMHIWDESVRTTPLYDGSTKTLGDFDGRELCLGKHVVMKRGLSFQAYQAYVHHSSSDERLGLQCLYGSPGRYNYQTTIALLRQKYLSDVSDEVADEYSDSGVGCGGK